MAGLVLAPPAPIHTERKGGKKNKPNIWIVLHTTEGHEGEHSAESLAAACGRKGDRTDPATGHRFGSSYQYVLDLGQVIPLVPEDVVSFSAPPANVNGIHIVFPGFARQSRDEWLDVVSSEYIDQCVLLVHDISRRTSIPLVKRTVDEVKASKSGYIEHKTVSDAFHKTDHSDVGPGFPWDVFAARVAESSRRFHSRRGTNGTTRNKEDDVPIAIKSDDNDAVFTLNGMNATHVPSGEIYNVLVVLKAAPPAKEIAIVSRSIFKSLRLIGDMPPGYTADDFLAVG
jgi:hypothetical protein